MDDNEIRYQMILESEKILIRRYNHQYDLNNTMINEGRNSGIVADYPDNNQILVMANLMKEFVFGYVEVNQNAPLQGFSRYNEQVDKG